MKGDKAESPIHNGEGERRVAGVCGGGCGGGGCGGNGDVSGRGGGESDWLVG